MIPAEVLERLPNGKLSLVDNRIVAGDSTWIVAQPITVVCVLHPKQTKPENRAFIKAILDAINASRDGLAASEVSQT